MSLTFQLPAWLGVDDLLVLSTALDAFLVLLAVWLGLVARDPLTARLRALAERRDALKAERHLGSGHRVRGDLRESSLSLMRRIVVRLNLLRGRHVARITLRLARAGWRSKDALVVYLFAKAAAPFVFGAGALAILGLSGSGTLNPGVRLLVLCGAFVAGLYGPEIYVKNATDKRVHRMRKGLPDALDLMVICAEAGLSLDAGMTRVGREMARSCPDLADEFSLAALELGFLPDRQSALQNLMNRTAMNEMRSLVNSLLQTERYGTPLAQSLRVLAAEFRDERLMRAEEKAAKLPAIMTVPMIVFILPALFIVLGGPAALRMMDALTKL
jgi:tight adherence protein C